MNSVFDSDECLLFPRNNNVGISYFIIGFTDSAMKVYK